VAKERDFPAVFTALKSILEPYAPHLTVKGDNAEGYSLYGVFSPQFKQDAFFGSAQIKKNYVSFYLMPVYMFPELLDGISERLSKRMQGKSCFNFTALDTEALSDLSALTEKSFARFQQEKLTKESK
jgi:hypothetical protein